MWPCSVDTSPPQREDEAEQIERGVIRRITCISKGKIGGLKDEKNKCNYAHFDGSSIRISDSRHRSRS